MNQFPFGCLYYSKEVATSLPRPSPKLPTQYRVLLNENTTLYEGLITWFILCCLRLSELLDVMRKLLVVLLALPGFTLPTLGDELDWSRCRAISDDAARLACYDALGPAPAAAAAAPGAAAADTAEQVGTTSEPATVAGGEPAPARASVPSPDPSAAFGIREKAAEPRSSHMVSRIPGTFRGWNAGSIITLENGQAWQIADGTSGVYTLENPQVRVERGLFGVYVLRIDGANRAPKVKRLQ